MESIDIIRLRIDALKMMRAYILQLKDNVSQYIKKETSLMINLKLKGIDAHEELLKNDKNQISGENNYYLSNNFSLKLNRLRGIKSLLINACGEAELLMPKREEEVKGKITVVGDED